MTVTRRTVQLWKLKACFIIPRLYRVHCSIVSYFPSGCSIFVEERLCVYDTELTRLFRKGSSARTSWCSTSLGRQTLQNRQWARSGRRRHRILVRLFFLQTFRLSWLNGAYVRSCDTCVTPADQAVAVTPAYGRILLFVPIFKFSKKYHARTMNGESVMFKTERLRMSLQWPIFALFNSLSSQLSLYVPPV